MATKSIGFCQFCCEFAIIIFSFSFDSNEPAVFFVLYFLILHLIPTQRQADAFSADELHDMLLKYDVRSPVTGNALTRPFPFNLMFKTTIGPEGTNVGFLRPETAQGLFVNFRWVCFFCVVIVVLLFYCRV